MLQRVTRADDAIERFPVEGQRFASEDALIDFNSRCLDPPLQKSVHPRVRLNGRRVFYGLGQGSDHRKVEAGAHCQSPGSSPASTTVVATVLGDILPNAGNRWPSRRGGGK